MCVFVHVATEMYAEILKELWVIFDSTQDIATLILLLFSSGKTEVTEVGERLGCG